MAGLYLSNWLSIKIPSSETIAMFVSAAHSRAKTHRERGSKLAFWNRGSPVHFFQLHNAGDSQSRVRRRTFGGIIPLIPLKRHREREKRDSKQAHKLLLCHTRAGSTLRSSLLMAAHHRLRLGGCRRATSPRRRVLDLSRACLRCAAWSSQPRFPQNSF